MSFARGVSEKQESNTEGNGEKWNNEMEEREWSAGDKVMAQDWLDSKWYAVKVLEATDEFVKVTFCERLTLHITFMARS